LLMPLAYYPPYAVTNAEPGFAAYARALFSLGFWPGGPAWFIWVLLVFDAVAAGLYGLSRRWTVAAPASGPVSVPGRPWVFAALLLGVSALFYIPMSLAFGADRWLTFGPFSFQASRPLLYATFFLAGVWLGASDRKQGLLARNGGLVQQWPIWVAAGLVAFAL